MRSPLRILYAAGPGNVIGTYRHWRRGQDDPSQVALTYSGQFYDVCLQMGAKAVVIASNDHHGHVKEGPFDIRHRTIPFADRGGLLYHFGQIVHGLGLVGTAIYRRADVAVVCGGTHWFVLQLLDLAGIRVVPTFHCVLWRQFQGKETKVQKLLRKLNGLFFARNCAGMLSISDDITKQVRSLVRDAAGDPEAPDRPVRPPPVTQFIPVYRPGAFDHIPGPPARRKPFRAMFAGRIEHNKGVFDLLIIARRFEAMGRTDIEFDLCGDGKALAALRQAARDAGLARRFRCHGHCNQEKMFQMYGSSHVVVVPTTTDFIEGFNKVVVEGVLAGRPVVTSSVCPSLSWVRNAVLEVPPDDVDAYGDAILRLCDDPGLYAARRAGCAQARAPFYNHGNSWATALRSVLERLERDAVRLKTRQLKRPVEPRIGGLSARLLDQASERLAARRAGL